MTAPTKPAHLRRAKEILAEAEEAFDGWRCPSTSGCCHFERTGREPYVTAVEWELIEEELSRQGRRLPAPRDDGACPFLTGDERCLVYAARPMGCRTFYCALAAGPEKPARRRIAALIRELEELAPLATFERGGRPLRSWIREKRSSRRLKGRRG